MASGGGYASFSTPIKASKTNVTVKVLECKVCEDVFSLQGERVPRLLHCGHTLCHTCLLRLPLLEDILQCPFDRQPTSIGSSGVWGLKKNFALLELLEKLQHSSDRTISVNVLFNEAEPEVSLTCDENEEHQAVLYCMVCGTHLCTDCAERTHATRTLIRHKRVPLSEKPRERPKCLFHPSHSVEFACLEESCQDAPLLCFICKDYGRHKGHSHALLDTEAEKLRNTIQTAMAHMKAFMEEVTEAVQRLDYSALQMEGMPSPCYDSPSLRHQFNALQEDSSSTPSSGTAGEARWKIRHYFRKLYEQLALQEAAALTVVDTHVRERLCSIRQRQEDLTMLLSQVAEVCVQCERAVRQDDARLVAATKDICVLLGSLEKQKNQLAELSPEQLQLDPSIPITFTKDNRVHIGPKIEVRVVTLGLDGAGKTSLLFKLKQNEFITTIPTIGFNVESIEYKNLQFTFWDVGGQPKLRPLWKHYYLNTQAVIFVVDSSCRERLPEVQSELSKLLAEKELKDAVLLILANKQDAENAASVEELIEQLTLLKLCYGRSWHAQGCDAPSGIGLLEGLDWLSCQLVSAGVYSTTAI